MGWFLSILIAFFHPLSGHTPNISSQFGAWITQHCIKCCSRPFEPRMHPNPRNCRIFQCEQPESAGTEQGAPLTIKHFPLWPPTGFHDFIFIWRGLNEGRCGGEINSGLTSLWDTKIWMKDTSASYKAHGFLLITGWSQPGKASSVPLADNPDVSQNKPCSGSPEVKLD